MGQFNVHLYCTYAVVLMLTCSPLESTLTPDNFTDQGRVSGWERVNWTYSIGPSFFLNGYNPFPFKLAPLLFYSVPPDGFTCQERASGWETLKGFMLNYNR